ncbi:MAG: hypothetical protein Q8L29_01745 [archaeon]|nr:hypothetical protein [archaeon]
MNYKIAGYGSLLSHKSLKETIPNKKFKKIIIKGFKRIFNVIDAKSKNPDVLNIEKSSNHLFNGILFSVNLKELKKLKEREDDYNLEEIEYYDFQTGKILGKCLIYIDHSIAIDHHHKNPNKKYFILCREAAYHINKKFGQLWDDTTFTSTGEKIADWIKSHKEYNSI